MGELDRLLAVRGIAVPVSGPPMNVLCTPGRLRFGHQQREPALASLVAERASL